METKFTPGPWYPGHLGDPETNCECRSIVGEGHAGGIAEVHMDNGIKSIADGGNDCPSREEAIANMHLIAAAPDLYTALKGMLTGPENESAFKWKAAEAAIAKAEGRQP